MFYVLYPFVTYLLTLPRIYNVTYYASLIEPSTVNYNHHILHNDCHLTKRAVPRTFLKVRHLQIILYLNTR
jgi:hypothetical protein